MTHITLETVDFTSYGESNIKELATQVANICEYGYGFFYLRLPQNYANVVKDIITAPKLFFDLPDSEKDALANDESCHYKIRGTVIKGTGPGYRGKGNDPNFVLDSRESFNLSSELFDIANNTGCGMNKWPRENLLPKSWKDTVTHYMEMMLDLSVKLRSVIGKLVTQSYI